MLYQPIENRGDDGNMGTVDLPGIDRFAAALLSGDKKISSPLGQFMASLCARDAHFGQIESEQ
jgi:hypothetical protein